MKCDSQAASVTYQEIVVARDKLKNNKEYYLRSSMLWKTDELEHSVSGQKEHGVYQ